MDLIAKKVIKSAGVRPYKINSLILITARRYFGFRVDIFLYFVIKYKFTARPSIFRDLVIFIFYIGIFAI